MKLERAKVSLDALERIHAGGVLRINAMTITQGKKNWIVDLDVEVQDPNDPPLIDGCRIVHRGDGFDVCKVHNRYWKAGSEMCPSKTEAAWMRVYEATHP